MLLLHPTDVSHYRGAAAGGEAGVAGAVTKVGCIQMGREMGQVGVAFLHGSLPSVNLLVFLSSFDFPSACSSSSPKSASGRTPAVCHIHHLPWPSSFFLVPSSAT